MPHFDYYKKCQWTERRPVILNKLKNCGHFKLFPNQCVLARVSFCISIPSVYNLSGVSGYNRAPQVCDCVCVSISLQVNDVQWSMSSIVSRRPPYPPYLLPPLQGRPSGKIKIKINPKMYIQGLSALALKSCLPKTFVLSKKGQKVLNMNSNHMFSYFLPLPLKIVFFTGFEVWILFTQFWTKVCFNGPLPIDRGPPFMRHNFLLLAVLNCKWRSACDYRVLLSIQHYTTSNYTTGHLRLANKL